MKNTFSLNKQFNGGFLKMLLVYTLLFVIPFEKTLSQPALQWQRCLGGTNFDEAHCSKSTPDGGIIVAGHTRSVNGDVSGNHGGYDAWLVKLDQNGSIDWKRCYGGSGDEWCRSVALTSDGGYVFTGLTYSNNGDVSGNHGDSDAWVVKTDAGGNIQWQRCLGGSKTDSGVCVQQTADGGYIVLSRSDSKDGQVSGNKGAIDFWVVKLNPNGQIVWEKSYGGSWLDFPQHICQTSDDGYIMTGYVYSIDGDIQGETYGEDDYWVVKLSPWGAIEWERTLGGSSSDLAYEAIQVSGGGYVVVGTSASSNWDKTVDYGAFDVWLVKLSPSGSIEWERTLGGSGEDRGTSVLEAPNGGGLYVFGHSASKDFDVSQNMGGRDYWLVRLSQSGQMLWELGFGGSDTEYSTSLSLSADGSIFLVGYSNSTDGDVSGNHSPNTTDYWVVKLSPESVSTSTPLPTPLQIAPNPAAEGHARITAGGNHGDRLWLTVSDMTGRPLKEQWGTDGGDIDLSGLPPGTYLIRAVAEDGAVRVGRLVKL